MGLRSKLKLWNLRRRMSAPHGDTPATESLMRYRVRRTDGPSYYITFKDEFIHRIYDFETQSPAPRIIDGGSHIGMSILYFKHRYPHAEITAFEPDPNVFAILQENVESNHLNHVTLINAGLGAASGTACFAPDGSQGGKIGNEGELHVPVHVLSDYLTKPVDFVKLNIEGQEWPVLQELQRTGTLGMINQMVIEYHGWANGEQLLGPILTLLDQEGFRYLVHDFDAETNPATKPPFRIAPRTTWFCLIYARRQD